jgi:hypothetical protein
METSSVTKFFVYELYVKAFAVFEGAKPTRI